MEQYKINHLTFHEFKARLSDHGLYVLPKWRLVTNLSEICDNDGGVMNIVRGSFYAELYFQLPAIRRKYNWYLVRPNPQAPPPYQEQSPSREGAPPAVNTQGLCEKPELESPKEIEQSKLPKKMVRPVIRNTHELATALADLSRLFSRTGRPGTLKSLTDALMDCLSSSTYSVWGLVQGLRDEMGPRPVGFSRRGNCPE
jgi:hypothetical protein